ncbi:hypothetical protein LMH73_007315 [Vibrio splendidus]|nr:hypothetical protein [Vibrio splendidus]MCC4883138.1 hypothetical protein [Vibrio splendidus]
MSEVIYADENRLVVRIHTRQEVKKLFDLLASQEGTCIDDVIPWPYVALKLFSKEQFTIGFNCTDGYIACDTNNNIFCNNVEIEINHPDTLAYFAAMVEYHMTDKKAEDLMLLEAFKLVLKNDSEFGYELPVYKDRQVQRFNRFEMKYDFSSSVKSVVIDEFYDINLLPFAELLQTGLPDFYKSRVFLDSLVATAKQSRMIKPEKHADDVLMFGTPNELPAGIQLFSLNAVVKKFDWNPQITDVGYSSLKSQIVVKDMVNNKALSVYDLIEIVIEVKNTSLDLHEQLIRSVTGILVGYDKATIDSCVAHLLNIATHPLVTDAIIEL